MALKVIEGVVEEFGLATALVSEAGPTGMAWTFVRFGQRKQKPATLEKVVADEALGAHLAVGQAGRFAFFPHDRQFVLCGFAGAEGIEIATAASDPASLAAETIRLPAKRKIFWGVVLIPTLIGLFFAPDMIKAGRAILRQNPAPRRPGDRKLTRALKGQLYWPFWLSCSHISWPACCRAARTWWRHGSRRARRAAHIGRVRWRRRPKTPSPPQLFRHRPGC